MNRHHKFPRRCCNCPLVLTNRAQYLLHLKLCKQLFCCPYCPRAFNVDRIGGHINTHVGNRPYMCPRCDRAFASSTAIKTHLETVHSHKRFSLRDCQQFLQSEPDEVAHDLITSSLFDR